MNVRSGSLLAGVFLAARTLAAEPATEVQQAAAALAPFKRELLAALTEGLAKGPENAVDACRLRAPDIAAAASTPVLDVGRTSHKLRNPANSPRDWMKPLLADYLARPDDRAPKLVELPNGRRGYVEPIVVQPMCTTCHGTEVAEAVGTRIKALYPADQATGFSVGDFRGMFWMEIGAR